MTDAYAPMPTQRVIAREGYPFLLICAALTVVFAATGLMVVGLVCLCLFIFVAFFFRNPERRMPAGSDLILSPADGRILKVEGVDRAPHINCPATKISIFMSVLNVHINRMPFSAKVSDVCYKPGKFFVASLDKASEHNERNTVVLEGEGNRMAVMTQIAGLVARRIVCYVRPGDAKNAGERFGLIRFGSRVDLFIPRSHDISVKVGDRVKAGSSIIGRWT